MPRITSFAAFTPMITGLKLYALSRGSGFTLFLATARGALGAQGGGRRFRVWELRPGRANEALDCRVYAYAALCGLLHLGLKLNRRADEIERAPEVLLPM